MKWIFIERFATQTHTHTYSPSSCCTQLTESFIFAKRCQRSKKIYSPEQLHSILTDEQTCLCREAECWVSSVDNNE